jgi:enoyl-CoA hydratase/carnithine racemase
MGLANRVVPPGKALEEAISIAELLLKFPNRCMQVDRASCYYSAYNARSFEDALSFEFDNGFEVVQAEGIAGAAKFSSGAGRGGSFEKL